VFTNGCFDILHAGHVTYLEEAKGLGDILILALNTDESIQRIKGPLRPIQTYDDRAILLSGLASIDFIIPLSDDTPQTLIEHIKPDILVKGADYTIDKIVGAPFVIENGGKVETIEFLEGRSTSKIIEKIIRAYK
jgi:rfaE bifunctional protein nucleotidyltransferase chain/domain